MPKIKIMRTKIIIVICLLMIMPICLGNNKVENTKKISRKIYIEKIDVGGLNINEARDEINKVHKIKSIKISYKDRTWIVKPEDIDLNYNLEDALDCAYNYTRTDDSVENIKRIFKLTFKEVYNVDLNATYNEAKLTSLIEEIGKEIDIKVKQASIDIKDSGEMVRTSSKEGREVDKVKLKEEIYDMINEKHIKDINLPIKIINPCITTEDVNSINTILGQYSTSFNDHSSRGSNIHVAGMSTSDVLLMPGETFSYNKATGSRTWSNGYKTAKVIVGGKFVNGEGGGVCQVSTTIYNAALLSGMGIEEVHNHTYPSRYAPKGKDAAVSYGYTDLKLKNIYSHPVYLKNIVSNGAITSKIYGCNEDREKLYIKTKEEYVKDKIIVKTYRVYLDEENNKIREQLIANSIYKLK